MKWGNCRFAVAFALLIGGPVSPMQAQAPPQRPIGTDYADRSNGAYQGRDPTLGRTGARLPLRATNRDGYPIGDPYVRTLPGQGGVPRELNGAAAARTPFQQRSGIQRSMFGPATAPGRTFVAPAFSGTASAATPMPMQNAVFAGFGGAANPIQMDATAGTRIAPPNANFGVQAAPRPFAGGRSAGLAPTNPSAESAAAVQMTPEGIRAIPKNF
jgi:hypothetical protein